MKELPDSIQIDHPAAREAFRKAYRHQMQGQLDEAIRLYKVSLQHQPSAEGHTFLGWAWSQKGDIERAIEECKSAIEVDPDFGNPYNDIGAYLLEQGKMDQARPWFQMALEAPRYESYCFPYYNLGRIHRLRGHFHKAAHYFKKSLEERPDFDRAEQALQRLQYREN